MTPTDGQPLFLAGLGSVRHGRQAYEGDGFVLVTGTADAAMLDAHDRRPLVLSDQDARACIELGTTFEEANLLANHLTTPAEDSARLGVYRVENDEPALNGPIGDVSEKARLVGMPSRQRNSDSDVGGVNAFRAEAERPRRQRSSQAGA